jgi:hypothetical protein
MPRCAEPRKPAGTIPSTGPTPIRGGLRISPIAPTNRLRPWEELQSCNHANDLKPCPPEEDVFANATVFENYFLWERTG